MSETVYSRAPDIVWRLGPDRVLVRRIRPTIGDKLCTAPSSSQDVLELIGPVALVWLALDRPAPRRELARRLTGLDLVVSEPDVELGRLTAAGLVKPLTS